MADETIRPHSAEQAARDILERMGVEDAQSFTAGDVVELANLISRSPTDPVARLRIANAALPDGHPNKITREDAALLDRFTSETSDGGEPERFYVCTWVPAEEMSRLARLAAKLSALLPPEDAR
jgi:hypothetical protein